ncbi:MAG: TniQ family protein [Terriglobia bacterium]
MTIPEPRLLFRVDPILLESPRGYVCRVGSAHGYDSPQWVTQLAGFSGPEAALEREDHARRMAYLLRLEPEEWVAMCYRRSTEPAGSQRSFYGKPISAYHLNVGKPRVCPACVREQSVWWAVWDLCLVAVCPIHRCLLLDQCPGCKKTLAWQRPAVHECRCGLDLRTLPTERADTDLVAINAAIYRAAGSSPGMEAEEELNRYAFPPELAGLTLNSLLLLLRCVGSFGHEDTSPRKRQNYTRTELRVAIQIGQTAVSLLRNWPHQLRAELKGMVPENFEDAAALRFHEVFGTFYFRLFRGLPRKEFGFLHDVFEEFVSEDWRGLVRGQHRFFSASTREKSPWIPVNQAAREARVAYQKIQSRVRQGQIEGEFFEFRRGRTQCWIKRASLNQWIASRDAEFGQYLSLRNVVRILGLQDATVRHLAKAGLIRNARSPRYGSPHGRRFLFSREDVMKIKLAFEKYAVPEQEYSTPGELIALRHAIQKYLRRDSGLSAAIQAVVDGALVPVAHTSRFPGITGYLFSADHLRLYRPVSADIERPPDGFLNYTEAASRLASKTSVIRALVDMRILAGPIGWQRSHSKLVAAADIQRFSSQYVAVTAFARQLHVTECWLRHHLKKSGTPTLTVPVGSSEKVYFLQKKIAAELRISPPRKSWR